MNLARIEPAGDRRFRVSGVLDYGTVAALEARLGRSIDLVHLDNEDLLYVLPRQPESVVAADPRNGAAGTFCQGLGLAWPTCTSRSQSSLRNAYADGLLGSLALQIRFGKGQQHVKTMDPVPMLEKEGGFLANWFFT